MRGIMTARTLNFLIYALCLVLVTTTQGQTTQPKWEKVYSEKGGIDFNAVSSAPSGIADSDLQWLWIGDDKGYFRLSLLNGNSDATLYPNQNAKYFALSKIDVNEQNLSNLLRQPSENNRSRVVTPPKGSFAAGSNPALKTQKKSDELTPIYDVFFLNDKDGFIITKNKIYRTNDAGFNWELVKEVFESETDGSPLLGKMALRGNRACVIGAYTKNIKGNEEFTNHLILCTDNLRSKGQIKWDERQLPGEIEKTRLLFNAFFLEEENGWIVGSDGLLLKTDDGGKSWYDESQKNIFGTIPLRSIYFINEKNGWIVGEKGAIFLTVDGGKTWKRVPPADIKGNSLNKLANASFESIKFASDKTHGWIIGSEGVIIDTNNSGKTWEVRQMPIRNEANLYALHVDEKFCWAVGGNSTVMRYKRR